MQPITCPYCGTTLRKLESGDNAAFQGNLDTWDEYDLERQRLGLPPSKRPQVDFGIEFGFCSICAGFVVAYFEGAMGDIIHQDRSFISADRKSADDFFELHKTMVIFPQYGAVSDISSLVPEEYRNELAEATLTLAVSPRASAALSRRLLERILTEEYHLSDRKLWKKIDSFLALDRIPTHIRSEVDAVRKIGNFALHPSKSSMTGQIVGVEPDEASWTLRIVKALLNYTYVERPANEKMLKELDTKLEEIGEAGIKRPKNS